MSEIYYEGQGDVPPLTKEEAEQFTRRGYREKVHDVTMSVSLSTGLRDAVDEAARKAGMNRSQWACHAFVQMLGVE